MLDGVADRAHLVGALGRAVRRARTARGWTQRDLADAAGLHVNALGAVERGTSDLRVGTLLHLAVALRTTASALLADAERDDPPRPR